MNEMCPKLDGNMFFKCQVEENAFSSAGGSNAVQSGERNIQIIIHLTAPSRTKTIYKLMQY